MSMISVQPTQAVPHVKDTSGPCVDGTAGKRGLINVVGQPESEHQTSYPRRSIDTCLDGKDCYYMHPAMLESMV